MSSSGESYTATTQEEAIIKAMVKLCKPCCRKHGNPGCCGDIDCVDGYVVSELSVSVSGCTIPCMEAYGYYTGGNLSCDPPVYPSNSSNLDTGLIWCAEATDFPSVEDCDGTWTPTGGGSGTIIFSSNYEPDGITITDKTQDSCIIRGGFVCFDCEGGTSPGRVRFCMSLTYQMGMILGDGMVWPTDPPTRPDPLCIPPGDPYYYSKHCEGSGTPTLSSPYLEEDYGSIYPSIQAYFHSDVLDFTLASCDPFIFSVDDLVPYDVTMKDGCRYTDNNFCGTVGGITVEIVDYEVIPLDCTEPKISATWSMSCVPCPTE